VSVDEVLYTAIETWPKHCKCSHRPVLVIPSLFFPFRFFFFCVFLVNALLALRLVGFYGRKAVFDSSPLSHSRLSFLMVFGFAYTPVSETFFVKEECSRFHAVGILFIPNYLARSLATVLLIRVFSVDPGMTVISLCIGLTLVVLSVP